MSQNPSSRTYLTLRQLCDATGFGPATIHRWKKAGAIPFFQPHGKRGRLRFPLNAIEICQQQSAVGQPAKSVATTAKTPSKLPGRRPGWTAAEIKPQQ